MRLLSKYRYILFIIITFIIIIGLLYFAIINDLKCYPTVKQETNQKFLPTIYVITPTYERYVQKAELTRMSHTLLLVNNLHWIIVEDSHIKTELVSNFLRQLRNRNNNNLKLTHLNIPTPIELKTKSTDPNWLKPRGVLQRNVGINWLRENQDYIDKNGIVYFADDDNTYDLKLFDEIRTTNKVSVWPVGLVGGLLVEKPIVDNNSGKVIGWNSLWKSNREFAIDMAGFAIKLKLLLDNNNALFSLKVARGFQETHILKQLINGLNDLEPKANLCTEILVWHTRTEEPKLKQEKKLKIPSNYNMEL